MNLTIAFITSRKKPKIEWFLESLEKQWNIGTTRGFLPIIIINHFGVNLLHSYATTDFFSITEARPKPNIWQGEHRVTNEDWWAKSNALNTAICLCTTEFIAFVDDRCVLGPMWLESVRDAKRQPYAVCGSYEKRANMKVENGEIIELGELLGQDSRHQAGAPVVTRDWYGGSGALPLEWCLAVNGFSEDLCDGLGSEDSMFGVTLRNSGFPMRYDSRMRIIEDRSPYEIDGALKRADKGEGMAAKSWAIVRAFYGKKSSQNSFDIRNLRARVQNGEPFPPPSASRIDWYDNQPISEMI